MTRLRRKTAPRGGRPLDLPQAFRLLGKGPSREELGWVVDRLREAEVEVEYDDELVEIAEAAGSSYFVALDLSVARYRGVEALTCSGPRARPVSELP